MIIDVTQLVACTGAKRGYAEKYNWELNDAMKRFALDTPARAASLIGQLAVESEGREGPLSAPEENLYYTTADRLRLIFPSLFRTGKYNALEFVRNPDGVSALKYQGYHGRGLIHLTWKDTYQAASDALGFDYVGNPDLVLEPWHAALTACWFFAEYKGLRAAADRMDVVEITKKVNGPAMLKLRERMAFTKAAYKLLSV